MKERMQKKTAGKNLKKLSKLLFAVFIVCLLLCPLGLIYQISQAEMEQYTVPELPQLKETAFGEVVQPTRIDVNESISVSGTFVSKAGAYQELRFYDNSQIRWNYSEGDEVYAGTVLGYYSGQEITAEYTGVIKEINAFGQKGYIRYQLFAPVELSCNVDDAALTVLKRPELELKLPDGTAVTVTFLSNQKNEDGTTAVRFFLHGGNHTYGEAVKNFEIQTGRVFSQALVVSTDAVYQKKQGEEEPWYVRLVTADGVYLGEEQVEVGYTSGGIACISGDGVSEESYLDAGYKAIIMEEAANERTGS